MKDKIEQRCKLFDYWDEIPFLVDIALDEVHLLEDPVRLFIFRFLRDGVEEEYPKKSETKKRRHAFSVKELHNAYINRTIKSQTLSVQNFHHHVNVLKEMGLLFEVAKILEGRHYVRYFGRVAKVLDNPFNENIFTFREKTVINPFKQLIQNLNPEMDYSDINTYVDDFHRKLSVYYQKAYRWILIHYDSFYDSKLDLQQFLFLTTHFAQFSIEFEDTKVELAKLLGFDKIDEYSPITPEFVLKRPDRTKKIEK